MLTQDQLSDLMASEGWPHVSIFMPTHKRGPETRQDPIRLKNHLVEAERRLTETGGEELLSAEIAEIRKRYLDDEAWWRHQNHGLAVFLAAGRIEVHKLPVTVEDEVRVGQRFRIRPLIPIFARPDRFRILAVDLEQVRLFEADADTCHEQPSDELPESIAEIVRATEFQASLAGRSSGPSEGGPGGPGAPPVRPQGFGLTARDYRSNAAREFFKRVANAVERALNKDPLPLVLVGGSEVQGTFRQYCDHPHLLPEGVERNPAGMEPNELHAAALAVVEPVARKALEDDIAHVTQAIRSGGSAATDLTEVVAAAEHGRIDMLLVARDAVAWGHFDPTDASIVVHDPPEPGDRDLIERVVVRTLANGGVVHVLEKDQLPTALPLAATLRY